MGRPRHRLDLVSPYFVPVDEGTAALAALAESGVKVRVLTNSLASSDVGAVHAGYAGRRAQLLRAGVRLYEIDPSAVKAAQGDVERWGLGSSAALHARTFAVDGSRVFVGSFNFDPRSARLNTEMGLVIDSPALARGLVAFLDAELPGLAYEGRTASMRRLLRLLCRCIVAAAANAAPPPPAVAREIDMLLARLEASRCEFNRNGSWHTAAEAKSHLLRNAEDRRGAGGSAEHRGLHRAGGLGEQRHGSALPGQVPG